MSRPAYIELVLYKGMADLGAEASRAYIGFIWWVMEPLLFMGAFYLAFGLGIRSGGAHMLLFLLSGLVPCKWFSSSVQSGSTIIQANSGLIQQVYLPKYILPWMVMVTNGFKFLIILGLLMLLAGFTQGFAMSWLALPVLVAVEMLLTLALASLTAALVPLLPDLRLIIDNGLIVLMFVSGIFTDVSRLPPVIRHVLQFNPIVPVIGGFHDVFVKQVWPDWWSLGWVTVFSLALYAFAYKLLMHYDRIYPKLMIL
jgi:lipopolysaccharide transport system permease protein